MSLQHFPISVMDLNRWFTTTTIQRGMDYHQTGAVISDSVSIDINDGMMTGFVQGRRRNPYEVDIAWSVSKRGKVQLDYCDCSCPVGENCKHAAALIFFAIGADQTNSGPPLSRDLSAWVSRLEKLTQSKKEVAPAEALIYLLRVTGDRNGRIKELEPDVKVSRYLQKGGFSASQKDVPLFKLATGEISCARPEDQSIGRMLIATLDPIHFSSRSADNFDLAKQLLRRMVETGRCFLEHKDNPPLTAGPVRKARLIWHLNYKGNQSAQLEILEGAGDVYWAFGPVYVDTSCWQIGPLDAGLPIELLLPLLESPEIAHSEARIVRERLQKILPGSIPLPSDTLEEEIRDQQPIACLTLTSREWLGSGANSPANFAVLSFDYGGAVFNLENDSKEIRKVVDNKLVITKRDLAFERTAKDRLHKCGFQSFPNWHPLKDKLVFSLIPNTVPSWLRFVETEVDKLRELGWRVEIDDSFQYKTVEAEGDWTAEFTESGEYWFSMELGIDFEGKRLSLLPILTSALRRVHPGATLKDLNKLNIDGKFYAPLPDGRWLQLPFERVESLLKVLLEIFDSVPKKKVDVSLTQVIDLLDADFLKWVGGARLKELAQKLAQFTGIDPIPTPRGFGSELRPYQNQGVGWLQFLREFGFGGILADDMGLGKTVQTLAHILIEKQNGRLNKPALVVCPTSVVPNWVNEAKRLTPQLDVLPLHGSDRSERFEWIPGYDLAVTSYALLVRDADKLKSVEWSTVILDEAQAIKNPRTLAADVARRLKADCRLCLTGTPVENHLGELWSQFHFLMPGLLRDERTFVEQLRTPIEKYNDQERLKLLKKLIAPFMLRRTKAEVVKELPPKTIMVRQVELEGDQRDLYETVRLAMHQKVLQEVSQKGFKRSQIIILDALLKLRQTCCDPRLLKLEGARSAKQSAKLNALMDMLSQMVEEGRRILLFSQFTSMLDLIEPELLKLRIPFVTIRGDTIDRETPVRRFQNGEVPLFLISLKAGGKGLNLTAADTVIHYDPWWNPAVEDQATDRAHRIGQDKPVFVYKIIASDTVEERMLELQEKKRVIADAIFDDERSKAPRFNEQDLEILFAPLPEIDESAHQPVKIQKVDLLAPMKNSKRRALIADKTGATIDSRRI
ncbi:MAG TPA: DEAD/DEAH box helicase [Candidatus Obscuribacterales bacterium]